MPGDRPDLSRARARSSASIRPPREGDRVTGPVRGALVPGLRAGRSSSSRPTRRDRTPASREAVREGLAPGARHARAMRAGTAASLRFLLANMVYQDALVALFAFGGIYGAGVFGWGADRARHLRHPAHRHRHGRRARRRPARRPLRREARRSSARSSLLGLVCVGVLSLGREHVLFVVATAPPAPATGSTAPRRKSSSSALGLVIGAVAGPLQASSRSLLARLVPGRRGGALFRPARPVGQGHVVSRAARWWRSRRTPSTRRPRAGGADPVLRRRRLASRRRAAA